ncbi:MAG: methyltransferase family protein [Vulcanimicrobiaceae bacterium]
MAITEKLKTTPPPLIFLAALLISLALNAIWPLVSIPDHPRYITGSLLIFGSLLPMPSILIKFRRMHTSFDVRKSPSAFIADGLYRFSRNPSYVALVLLFIGLSVALSNLWVLILLVPAAVIIDRYVIPEEERRLERVFGDQYRAYKLQVRRWL